MKYLVVSDIHGSLYYANKILELIKEEQVNKVILLGDLYYHGPRNPLPRDYNPKEVANILNNIKEMILCVKGNCDAEVDEMISEFTFNQNIMLEISNKKFMFTHGHKYNIDNKVDNIDVLVYGHFHTGFIKEENNVVYVNAGSITLPKNNTKNSYLVIENSCIYLKDLDKNIIDRINF